MRKKVVVLWSVMAAETYNLLCNLAAPNKPADNIFRRVEILQKLSISTATSGCRVFLRFLME